MTPAEIEFITVPIRAELFIELASFLNKENAQLTPVLAVSTAIDYWLQNAGWKPELYLKEGMAHATRGYQWKSVFLRHGTLIRMPHDGEYAYAKVEGDEIIYNGKPISAGSLANSVAGHNRNAWMSLWIKRPGDAEWMLADMLRSSKAAAT